MPDISMCGMRDCPSRMACYRYRAVPNGHSQAYSFFPLKKDEDRCQHFMEIWPKSKVVPEADCA
jgi:hypothetical protein